MAETLAPPVTETAAPQGLIARIFGVLLAPRKTYAGVAARPRSLGMLAVVLLIIATGSVVFSSTEIGRQALLDQQVRTMESFGIKLPDQAYQRMEEQMARPYTPYVGAAAAVVVVPIVLLVIAGIALAIFNAVLGGDATFKQVFAVVVHAGVISAFQQLFVYPLDYARESMSSATKSNSSPIGSPTSATWTTRTRPPTSIRWRKAMSRALRGPAVTSPAFSCSNWSWRESASSTGATPARTWSS